MVGCQAAVEETIMPVQSDYERVVDTITAKIRSGEWPPGSRIPSITQLASELGTSQTTVKSAQMLLRHAGLLVGRQGKGVFVADPVPQPED